jgi:hypothetical protein
MTMFGVLISKPDVRQISAFVAPLAEPLTQYHGWIIFMIHESELYGALADGATTAPK